MKAALVRVSQKPECEVGISYLWKCKARDVGHRVLLGTELSFPYFSAAVFPMPFTEKTVLFPVYILGFHVKS